jgi:hypothetical protein
MDGYYIPHCKPLIVYELRPLPLSARTLTAIKLAFFATPYVLPPMVPATCWVHVRICR